MSPKRLDDEGAPTVVSMGALERVIFGGVGALVVAATGWTAREASAIRDTARDNRSAISHAAEKLEVVASDVRQMANDIDQLGKDVAVLQSKIARLE